VLSGEAISPGLDLPPPNAARLRAPPLQQWRTRLASNGTWMLAPFLVLYFLFFMVPIGYAVYESFFTAKTSGLGFGGTTVSFSGLSNYLDVLKSTTFRQGLGRVFLFALVNIPLTIGLAVVLALLLDMREAPLRRVFRLAFFLPFAIPGVVGALLWSFLYQPSLSPYSRAIANFHFGDVNFLSGRLVFWAIANIVIWGYAGYNMLIVTAALNAIPQEQFDAARIDGCSRLNEIRYLKLPQILPALVLIVLFGIIGTLQLFNEPEVLTEVTTTISNSYTPTMYAYTAAFTENNYYYGAAVAVTLALLTLILSFGFLRLVHRQAGL
jgi:multiple sugar transport system permease protein